MDFEQKKRVGGNVNNYHVENVKAARDFSKKLLKEMGELARSIVLFGSNTHNTANKNSDIDLMIVLDNVSVFVSEELREAYKIITNKLVSETNPKLHIMTINLSDLWDMARKGDPVLINILRYGVPLFDRDLVEPMQYLLEIGRIRPTREAVNNYMSRSEVLLDETKRHLEEAVMDLYYCVVDAVHAALMSQNVMPASPKEMPAVFKKKFKDNKEIGKYAVVIEEFYKIVKDIEYRKGGVVTGVRYDVLRKKAEKLVLDVKKFVNEEMKKKDSFEL